MVCRHNKTTHKRTAVKPGSTKDGKEMPERTSSKKDGDRNRKEIQRKNNRNKTAGKREKI